MQPPRYWNDAFGLYYEAYLQEKYAEFLSNRWGKWNFYSSLLITGTATGSTVGGLTFWRTQSGHLAWVAISSIAAITSLVSSGLHVPQRVKEQGDLRGKFLHARLQLADLQQDMAHLPETEQKTRFERLRGEFNSILESATSDFLLSEKRRAKIQKMVDDILRKKGVIK